MKAFFNRLFLRYQRNLQGISLPLVMFAFTGLWFLVAYLVYIQESPVPEGNIKTFADSLWWGVVSYLTVGYGDRFPVTGLGRLFGVVLMFGGVLVTSLITARISSVFFEAALKKRRGVVDSDLLKDHFVICGWTEDMEELLLHILDFNQGLKSHRVVVLSNVDENTREAIWAHPRLKDIGFISGDYFTEAQIRRAMPEKARKVLILADRTPSLTGQVPTPVEIDARTIMTAMSLANISRATMVTAEILDPKMAQYLKIAGVSEIIYSREYSRLLIGNASSSTGVVNILYDLLDPNTPSKISTIPIPSKWIGKTYREVKLALEEDSEHLLVVGLLENVGNQHSIKEQALRKAQQTPDVHKLVNNLQSIRDIKCNSPHFNPDPHVTLNDGTLLIVLENRMRGVTHGQATPGSEKRVA